MRVFFGVFAICAVISNLAVASAPDCESLTRLTVEAGERRVAIEKRMDELGVPGVSLALIQDFSLACTATFGVKSEATQEPITPETLFQVASISKPVTAVAVLKKVESGTLDLDGSINGYLSAWRIPAPLARDADPDAITVRQVLSHTAGLSTPSFAGYGPGDAIPTVIQILNGTKPANSEAVRLIGAPGKTYAYSGGGYTILQLLLEELSGQSFEHVIAQTVFEPLGIKGTSFRPPNQASQTPNFAMGYADILPASAGGYQLYPELAAAGLWANAQALSKFVIGLQRSLRQAGTQGGILSPVTAKAMMTPFEGSMSGLGIVIDDMYFTHGGINRGYMSRFLSHDTDGYGLVILTNAEQPRLIGEVITAVGKAYEWEDF